MTPLEAIQGRIANISRSEVVKVFLRNARWAILTLLGIGASLVVIFLMTSALYSIIGGWAIALGAIVAIGLMVAAIVTAFEVG